jgi:predicted nucleic acid-binding protein
VTLLDTSSLVHFLRRKGDLSVKARVKALLLRGDAVLCDLVVVELWMGVSTPLDGEAVKRLSTVLPILPTNDAVWLVARALGGQCRRMGAPVPSSDILIAACAFAHRAEIEAEDAHFEVLSRAHAALG